VRADSNQLFIQGNRVNGKLTICAGLPAFSLSSLKEGGEETKFGSEAGSRFTRLPWLFINDR
jgi:hypothetical protein